MISKEDLETILNAELARISQQFDSKVRSPRVGPISGIITGVGAMSEHALVFRIRNAIMEQTGLELNLYPSPKPSETTRQEP